MGFFAENIREHFSEQAKEKEYIHSLIIDFKNDTAIINNSVANNKKIEVFDLTFLKLLKENKKDSASLIKLAEYYKYSQNFFIGINDSKTYDELKSTGDFRLIKNRKVFDSVSHYYQQIANMKTWLEERQSNLINNYIFGSKIIDLSVLGVTDSSGNIVSKFRNSDLQTPKPASEMGSYRFEYINRLTAFVLSLDSWELSLKIVKARSVALMALLEKEYDVDGE